jgi:tRNA (mo5U34)-methyltransferase
MPNIAAQIAQYQWFHSINLGNGVTTPGIKSRDQHLKEAAAIFNPIRMDGVSVIDIGAWDGFYSFEAKHRGAGHVLATDHYCWNHEALRGRETFELARSALGLDIEMLDIDVPDLSVEKVGGQFDVVLFLGVFYHLIDPIDGLRRAASLAKEVLVVETHTDGEDIGRPAMIMYPGTELGGDPTNWWGPNNACIKALLGTMGFARVDGPVCTDARPVYHAWRSPRLSMGTDIRARNAAEQPFSRTAELELKIALTESGNQAARIRALEAELDAVRASTSWRITAPLRRARMLFS